MTDQAAITAGREAWQRICRRSRTSFDDWVAVGKAVAIGRAECLQRAGTDRAFGRIYQRFMADWLIESGLDGIQSQERYWALQIVDNLAGIQRWRATLDDEQRRKWNHPQAIWSNWRGSLGDCGTRQAPAPQRRIEKNHTRGNFSRIRFPQDFIRRAASAMRDAGSNDLYILARVALEAAIRNEGDVFELVEDSDAKPSRPALAHAAA